MVSEEVLDLMKSCNEVVDRMDKLYDELAKKQSKVDKSLVDIYHFIEFSNFNARDGYKAYKLLRECLQKRRTIKDSIEALNIIKCGIGKKTIETMESNVSKCESGGKKYSPRVFPELFEDCVFNTDFSELDSKEDSTKECDKEKSFFIVCYKKHKDLADDIVERFDSTDKASVFVSKLPVIANNKNCKGNISKIKDNIEKAMMNGTKYCSYYWKKGWV